MFISNEHTALRALEPQDVDLLYNWENKRSLWSYSYTTTPFSKFVLEEFVSASIQDIYTNKQLRLMIVDKTTGETVGCIDLFDFDPQHARAGIGVFVEEQFRGKGFAGQAVQLVLKYCFETLLLHQVYAEVSEKNTESILVFLKSGFTKTAVKHQWHKVSATKFEDVVLLQRFSQE